MENASRAACESRPNLALALQLPDGADQSSFIFARDKWTITWLGIRSHCISWAPIYDDQRFVNRTRIFWYCSVVDQVPVVPPIQDALSPGPRVTFRGNSYDLASLVSLATGGLILFTCLTCYLRYYCMPIIPMVLGLVEVCCRLTRRSTPGAPGRGCAVCGIHRSADCRR